MHCKGFCDSFVVLYMIAFYMLQHLEQLQAFIHTPHKLAQKGVKHTVAQGTAAGCTCHAYISCSVFQHVMGANKLSV